MHLPALAPLFQQYRLVLLFAFVLFGLIYNYRYFANNIPEFPQLKAASSKWLLWSSSPQFWETFAPLLASAAPKCPPPQLIGKATAENHFKNPNWRADPQPNYINMTDEDVASMQESHSSFVDHIINDPPALNFEPGTQGIVTSAGGAYFPVLLVSILMLRRTGSTLPVEIFLATESEYESQACSITFPALNAKCIVLSTFLTNPTPNFSLKTYQIKIFAILFSSFEEVLFLDADDFPAHTPEQLFTSEPFISNHLILWPDYWTPTFSPYFTNITSLPPSILNSRPTIEAGQILVSKSKQSITLMLAAYYNAYSEYFYHLITQGGPGEGDKDTVAAAALSLNASFYTVRHGPVPLGVRADGAAVLQFDPIADYLMDGIMDERPFFIHASWPPKLNPLRNVRSKRQWGSEQNSKALFKGVDIERVVWGYMVEMACSESLEFGDWGEGNKTSVVMANEGMEMGLCERTRLSFRRMFGLEYVRGKDEGWNGTKLGLPNELINASRRGLQI